MEEAGWGCSGERPCLLKPGRVWYVYVGRQGMMVDPWAAIADVSVGKQAFHLISRLAPPRLRARILGCVDHDDVHANMESRQLRRPRPTDRWAGCHGGWSGPWTRPAGLTLWCGGTPKSPARFRPVDPDSEGVLCVVLVSRLEAYRAIGRDSFSAQQYGTGSTDGPRYSPCCCRTGKVLGWSRAELSVPACGAASTVS